jgi:hypothetical protein
MSNATSNPDQDSELHSLAGQLAKSDSLLDDVLANENCDAFNSRFHALHAEHWGLLERINRLRATTLTGLAAKACAAEIAFKRDEDASNEGEGSFVELARSINRDLLALSPAPFAA